MRNTQIKYPFYTVDGRKDVSIKATQFSKGDIQRVGRKGEPERCSVTRGRGGGVKPEGLKFFSEPTYIGLSVPLFSLLR